MLYGNCYLEIHTNWDSNYLLELTILCKYTYSNVEKHHSTVNTSIQENVLLSSSMPTQYEVNTQTDLLIRFIIS